MIKSIYDKTIVAILSFIVISFLAIQLFKANSLDVQTNEGFISFIWTLFFVSIGLLFLIGNLNVLPTV